MKKHITWFRRLWETLVSYIKDIREWYYFKTKKPVELLPEVKKIFNQHPFNPIKIPAEYKNLYHYLRENPNKIESYKTITDEWDLLKKYRKYIPKGWYGFDIGTPIIPAWMVIIEKVLDLCVKHDPLFQIHQIKMKYGGIRFYVSSCFIKDISKIVGFVEDELYDEKLVY